MADYRAGYVALIGEANAGKSTLLNTLVGERLAIVTPKPHTTRRRLLGIANSKNAQIVFVDTPGFIANAQKRSALGALMQREAGEGAAECDLLVLVVDVATIAPRSNESSEQTDNFELEKSVRRLKELTEARVGMCPDLVVLNKVDLLPQHGVLPLIAQFDKIFNQPDDGVIKRVEFIPVSAKKRSGIEELERVLIDRLPPSDPLFPEEEITTAPERFIAAEILREKAIILLRQEIPYAIAVEVERFVRQGKLLNVGARLIVEKDSQKGIVIGQGGGMLKRIGTEARLSMEEFFQEKVHLELVVSVEKAWSETASGLQKVGMA